ncbi:hypothetical protein K432DRAFT_396554 [Lepidopterella palustris CBS 459.81]|uniref:Beta-ketoacyl synthase-like N-terminal domain-containing protein n=1 Tax=Lepidopterella palustris CBS 459.81 TaxID=1314670 RepID=A0A8E2JBU8_9PEZI|nr:hypothetical protein K432DRAFT_396554 [Lepidopterella palustris CBS 459.81]
MLAHSDSSSNGASIPSGSNGIGIDGVHHGTNGFKDTNGTNGTNGTHHAHTHTDQDAARSGAPIPIAIVSMACRFGGDVHSPSKLWDLCAAVKDSLCPIPEQRFDAQSLYHQDKNRIGRCHVVGGYFMSQDISVFDAGFFNLAANVATITC